MKKVEVLRRKYPRFVYENFDWEISGKDLKISFDFRIEPNLKFKPTVIIKNIDKKRVEKIGDRVLDNLVFNLGLIELLSYWKATCSPEILIKTGYLSMKASPSSPSSTNLRFVSINKEQIKYPSVAKGGDERKFIDWWKDLIINGMGQFFYENKVDFRKSNFLKIKTSQIRVNQAIAKFTRTNLKKVLVPVGGGKDSVVTLEILKNAGMRINCFSLNPTDATQKIIKVAGCKDKFIVRRETDPKLLELNRKGFLNGHTPFSAYLAFLSTLVAVIFGQKYIAFSNERSSNEGNVKYFGKIINHQYSKSFDFEKKFREYSKKYLSKNIEYYSFLRPLYEIQIAKLFSKYSKYFNTFLSCNEAYKTYSGQKLPTNPVQIASRLYGARKWCGSCPKCLFVFTALYPFIEESELLKIFGKNLFKDKNLLPLILQLIGERKFKPFECVGTKKESLIAFYLALRSFRRRGVNRKPPTLLCFFEKRILPKYPNIEKESKKLMNSWNNQHNLPKEFEKILKTNIIHFLRP
jgi:hypothetical protein